MSENKQPTNDTLELICIKTNKGYFITDCNAKSGYDFDYHYHKSMIPKLVFDDKKATAAYCKNWYFIEHYPSKIQREVSGGYTNKRYELIDESLESEKLPKVIPYEDKDNYSYSAIENLYSFDQDKEPDYLEDFKCEIQVVCEVEDYNFPPQMRYSAVEKQGWSDSQYTITNADVQHQMLDKLMFPELLLHERPCKFTSKQMYDMTRQYILEHIDNSVAKITSNYDFCFTVKKLIPLIEPETITYQNIFARTKRERSKVHTKIKKFVEKEIFEMTDDKNRYQGYPVIPEMTANSEAELKEKVDTWLEGLMEIINEPLCQCPHCKGSGYIGELKKGKFDYK